MGTVLNHLVIDFYTTAGKNGRGAASQLRKSVRELGGSMEMEKMGDGRRVTVLLNW